MNNAKGLSKVAKNQQTDPLEALESLQAFIKVLSQDDQQKAAEFKSAIMVLASPNSIALSSNEDIHVSANGQISQTAGDSMNISTQKSLIGHAGKKISLFAAQEGLRAFAGKGKVEIQAQDDGVDLIARKGIQIISTEDTIYITSPKEINLTAGGSQIKINGSGVFPTTGGKFEAKAGEHKFVGGEKIVPQIPRLPLIDSGFSKRFIIENSSGGGIKNIDYFIFFKDGSIDGGKTDVKGRTKKILTKNQEEIEVHFDYRFDSGIITKEI